MRNHLVALCLFAVIQGATADTLYVRNRPFTGVTLSDQGKLFVQLDALCKALELKLQEREGTYYLGNVEALPETTPANTLWVDGQQIAIRSENGTTLIALEDASPVLGLKVVPNRSLGTIDVFKVAPAAAGPGLSAVTTGTGAAYDPTAYAKAFYDDKKECWGVKDAQGKVVASPKFRSVQKFEHGLAGACLLEMQSVTLKVKGTETRTTYQTVSGVRAPVDQGVRETTRYRSGKVKKETLMGVINTQGEWLIEPQYDRIRSIRRFEKLTYIEVEQGGKTFFVHPNGRRARHPDDVYRDQFAR